MVNLRKSHYKRGLGMTLSHIAKLGIAGMFTSALVIIVAVFLALDAYVPVGFFRFANPQTMVAGRWAKIADLTTPTATSAEAAQVGLGEPNSATHNLTRASNTQGEVACDFAYPSKLEFFRDGTYAGQSDPLYSEDFIWPGGQYEIIENYRVKMEIQNGLAVYPFTISGDILTFKDDGGCLFSYRRVK